MVTVTEQQVKSGYPPPSSIRGVKLIFTRGHISLVVAFKGLNIILGLYKRNYSLTVNRELPPGRN